MGLLTPIRYTFKSQGRHSDPRSTYDTSLSTHQANKLDKFRRPCQSPLYQRPCKGHTSIHSVHLATYQRLPAALSVDPRPVDCELEHAPMCALGRCTALSILKVSASDFTDHPKPGHMLAMVDLRTPEMRRGSPLICVAMILWRLQVCWPDAARPRREIVLPADVEIRTSRPLLSRSLRPLPKLRGHTYYTVRDYVQLHVASHTISALDTTLNPPAEASTATETSNPIGSSNTNLIGFEF